MIYIEMPTWFGVCLAVSILLEFGWLLGSSAIAHYMAKNYKLIEKEKENKNE